MRPTGVTQVGSTTAGLADTVDTDHAEKKAQNSAEEEEEI